MNDVRVSGVDFAARQSSSASSNPTNSTDRQTRSTSVEATQSASDVSSSATQPSPAIDVSEAVDNAQASVEGRVEQAVTQLNDFVQSVQRDLQFELDDDSGRTIVTVVDRQTSEVVRQIPDEVAVRLAQDLQQDEPLSLISTRV